MNDKITFHKGSFAVFNGKAYRAKTYMTEYELFDIADTDQTHTLMRIDKTAASDSYSQFAHCEIAGVRYTAVCILEDCCYYSSFSDYTSCVPVEQCDEIWLLRVHSDGRTETETILCNVPYGDRPSGRRFHAERMANGNIMTCHLANDLSLQQTVGLLLTHYGSRMSKPVGTNSADEYFGRFTVDNVAFDLSYDIWDLVCISPAGDDANSYIHEFARIFNDAYIKEHR